MGEFSKRIGEIGEDIVIDFLALIGWHNPDRNFDIPSTDPEKHGKDKHGIDAYFHYRSPMIARTLENILISTKYSKDKYPNDPVKKFKEYYKDLGMAIESFKKSDLRATTNNSYSDFETVFDRGIIFWLNNVDDDSQDILQILSILRDIFIYLHHHIIYYGGRRRRNLQMSKMWKSGKCLERLQIQSIREKKIEKMQKLWIKILPG